MKAQEKKALFARAAKYKREAASYDPKGTYKNLVNTKDRDALRSRRLCQFAVMYDVFMDLDLYGEFITYQIENK